MALCARGKHTWVCLFTLNRQPTKTHTADDNARKAHLFNTSHYLTKHGNKSKKSLRRWGSIIPEQNDCRSKQLPDKSSTALSCTLIVDAQLQERSTQLVRENMGDSLPVSRHAFRLYRYMERCIWTRRALHCRPPNTHAAVFLCIQMVPAPEFCPRILVFCI